MAVSDAAAPPGPPGTPVRPADVTADHAIQSGRSEFGSSAHGRVYHWCSKSQVRGLPGYDSTTHLLIHRAGSVGEGGTQSPELDVLRLRQEDVTATAFVHALSSGVPAQITGVDRRMQSRWTPEAFTENMDDAPVKCIDCNSDEEKSTTMRASAFFEQLRRPPGQDVVYKIKVGRMRPLWKVHRNDRDAAAGLAT